MKCFLRVFFTSILLLPVSSLADWDALAVTGGITAVYLNELDRGEDDVSVSGDVILELPTANGGWFLYIEGATGVDADSLFNVYPEINADAGSVLDRNGGGALQVSELNYRFDLAGRAILTVGQIDPSAQLDRSRIANDENTQFLGASFVNNPTIEFPDYTLGMMYRLQADDRKPEMTVIVASSDGIADNPGRSYSELVNLTAAGKGVFAAAGARWFLGKTRIGTGAWLRSDDHPHLDDPQRNSQNYGAYAIYGFVLGQQTINLRAGIANKVVSPATRFWSLAYERNVTAGNLGIGFARIMESSRARSVASGDTNHAEAWFRTPLVNDSLHLTATLQYVSNPGFDRTGITADANATFAGLRLDYAF